MRKVTPAGGSRPSPASAGSRALRVTADLRQRRSSPPRGASRSTAAATSTSPTSRTTACARSAWTGRSARSPAVADRDSRGTADQRPLRAWPAHSTSRRTEPGTSTSPTRATSACARSAPRGRSRRSRAAQPANRSCLPSGSAESSTSAPPCACERSLPPARSPRWRATADRASPATAAPPRGRGWSASSAWRWTRGEPVHR